MKINNICLFTFAVVGVYAVYGFGGRDGFGGRAKSESISGGRAQGEIRKIREAKI